MGGDSYFRFILALIFVIALIGVLALLARRLGLGFPAQAMKAGSARRIGVVEVAPLDARRKLVLVRRDDVEHLLVISPTAEVVIETNIKPGNKPGTDFKSVLADKTPEQPS